MKKCLDQLVAGMMVILSFSSCSDDNSAFLASGISQELALFRKATIDNIVYDLHFEVPAAKNEAITGLVTIHCTLNNTDKDLVLDFNAPSDKIKSIIVNNEPVEVLWKQEHLIIPANYIQSENSIQIDFEAGEQSLNRSEDYLYTLFVPDRASTCFPLFDQPDLKARYNLSLSIPSAWKAVANGKVQNKQENDGRTRYEFAETNPISSYLFSFAVGDFQVISRKYGDRVMNMYHRETDSTKLTNNLDAIFSWHERSLEWMESYTGISLPFRKFDFVLIPSFQYSGMEHPGAILYNASSLLLDSSSTLKEQLNRARLIAHETAHMWFGNLVTMRWFDDVWLKEVFANLMAAKIVNPGFPDVNHDLQFLMSHYPAAYSVDRTAGTHPIQQPLDNLKNAGSLYGDIIYHKAPIVMRMLEEGVGEERFRDSLRRFLKKYAYSNAKWNDLIALLAKYASFEIENWNEQWVRSAGMPVISYKLKGKANKDIDSFKLWSKRTEDKAQLPNQDLEVLFGYSRDSGYRVQANFLTASESFNFRGRKFPAYLFFNSNGKGYGYFKMDLDSKKYFFAHINGYEDPVLRGALWINLYESMLRGAIAPDELINLGMESLLKEEEALIAEYITGIIESIYWRFITVEERSRLAPRLEGLLLNMVVHTPSMNLKSTYFNALKSIAISDHGVLILKKIWSEEIELDGLQLSEEDLTSLAYELAVREVEGYKKILQVQKKNITNPDRRRKFAFIQPALSADTAVRDAFFESLKNPQNRENEAWVLEALSFLHHPLRAQTSIKYIGPSLQLLDEIQLTGDIFFPKGWVDRTLSGHSSPAAEHRVRTFLDNHDHYPERLKHKILQAADMLFRSVALKQSNNE